MFDTFKKQLINVIYEYTILKMDHICFQDMKMILFTKFPMLMILDVS